MSRPIHFEIHVDDVERAKQFYAAVFGWTYEDWSAYVGSPYVGAMTGAEGEMGINGALMQRHGSSVGAGQAVNGAVLTMGVEDYDAAESAILGAGGKVALPKAALPGMAWQGYYLDTEGNVFGIHQPDPEAR